jgi:hypothetical protein
VVSSAGLIVNSADVPSVTRVGGSLVAHWTEENGPDPEASTLRIAWSTDDGRTWTRPLVPYADRSETQHGFASLFEAQGGTGVVWIDGRTAEAGQMGLRARLFDKAGNAGAEMMVDDRVCECCSTSVASTPAGPIVAFRNRSDNEVRDIYVSRLSGGKWTTPALVHKDDWELEACPVNGPSIAASGSSVAVAWFTLQGGQGHALAGFSGDGGRTFGAPIRLDDQTSTGRVQIGALPDGSMVATWVEYANSVSSFRVRRVQASGARSPAVSVASGVGGQHPRVGQANGEVVLAWTENSQGSTRVRTATASVR